MIKHATASVFVFHHDAEVGWRTGMVKHPIFGVWIMPGGHVEETENPAEAALREAGEETGLTELALIEPYRVLPLPGVDTSVPVPCWIVEHVVERDNHLAEPHVHVDHKYAAVSSDAVPTGEPAHPFAWFTLGELADLPAFDDVRSAAAELFALIETGVGVPEPT